LPRILSIDYGLKRTGLAVTDPLQIIATGLTTVESKQLIPYLKNYFSHEEVELIIIGEPKNWDDTDTHATPLVEKCIKSLQKNFPAIPIKKVDERYTSKMAKDAMIKNWLMRLPQQLCYRNI
jgi:putative Holliday junction resolvase